MTDNGAQNKKVMLIGWDAADWRVIDPLIEQGKMPVLAKLIQRGVRGNIATLHPVLSPMLWSSIATGKRPYKHGVHGFTEPTPEGNSVRPVSGLSRKTKAIWNILNQHDKRSIVVGWWPSHPAEPIDGVMVSNFYQRSPEREPKEGEDRWPMVAGTVHPERLAEPLREFQFHYKELAEEHLLPFIPRAAEIDQKKDQRLYMMARTLAETTSIQGATTALMQLEEWDFLAAYFDGIDHFCHGFMKYHPPRQPWVKEEDFELYSGVIEAAYRFHDMMLGAQLELAGDDTTVMLISDHGFHPDHLRPATIPAEPAGPAVEHRDYGIFVMAGPGVRKGEEVHGTSVLDVCPTLLSLFGLPVGLDMDGKPQLNAFEQAPEVSHIPTWDAVEGRDGMHAAESRVDAASEAEVMRQLVDLGYIEEPGQDQEKAVKECVRELQYNLAQAYMDGGLHGPAATILESLWEEWDNEHRFGQNLIGCYGALGESELRSRAIDTLEERTARYAQQAIEELEELRPKVERFEPKDDDEETGREVPVMPKPLQFKLRKLTHLAQDRGMLISWFRATQAMYEGDASAALELLEPLNEQDHRDPGFHNQVGSTYLRLRRHAEAAQAFERALVHDSDNADALLGLAEARVGLREWDGVVDAALSAAELMYFNPRAHTLLGRALIRTGELEAAEAALRVALAQAPQFAAAHRSLAFLYRRHLDQPERALEHREAARQIKLRVRMDKQVQRAAFRGEEVFETERGYSDAVPPDFGAGTEPVVVVSGLPRSGTSMMMQMLGAGGLALCTDSKRAADASNERGYYEDERVLRLQRDASWIAEARGRAVKVVAPLLSCLPDGEHYNVIFMERPIERVVKSQRTMLDRLGRGGSRQSDDALAGGLAKHLRQADAWADSHPNVRVLHVAYEDVISDPASAAARVGTFLGGTFDHAAASGVVDATLRHERG